MLKRIISLIVLLLVAAVCPAQNAQYLHGLIGRKGGGGGGLEITGAIDRDVRLGETLAIGDIIEVTGKVYVASQPVRTADPTASPTANVPAITGSCITMSADGMYLVVANYETTPYFLSYKWDTASATYRKTANVNTTPNMTVNGVSLSADGQRLAISGGTTPYIKSYKWSAANNRYEVTAAATAAADGGCFGIKLSADGEYLAVVIYGAGDPAVFLNSYKWNAGNNRYEKTTSPNAWGLAQSRDVAMTPDGQTVVVAAESGSRSYKWDVGDGRYEVTSEPNVALPSLGLCCAISEDGSRAAFGLYESPYLVAYNWNATATRYEIASYPDVSVTGSAWGISMSSNGEALILGHSGTTGSSPYLASYNWNATANRYEIASAPDYAPSGIVYGVAMSANGAYIAASHDGTNAPVRLATYRADLNHTLKAFKADSGTFFFPTDLMYFGVMSEAGDADDVKAAKMFYWKYDPLETMDP